MSVSTADPDSALMKRVLDEMHRRVTDLERDVDELARLMGYQRRPKPPPVPKANK